MADADHSERFHRRTDLESSATDCRTSDEHEPRAGVRLTARAAKACGSPGAPCCYWRSTGTIRGAFVGFSFSGHKSFLVRVLSGAGPRFRDWDSSFLGERGVSRPSLIDRFRQIRQ